MHLIALGLKKKLNVKWVADFRDPWTNIDFYHELRLTKHSDKKHRSLEKEVLKYADEVITIGKTLSEEMAAIGSRKVNVITNGYDASDLQNDAVDTDMKFSISHIGTLSKSRNPVQLWKALAELVKEEKLFADSLEIKLAGKVDFHIKQSLNECGLEKHVHYIDYIPHDEVAKLQQQSQVLLLILNDTPNAKGILTGKLFEYMAALRPILCIGRRDGDAAVIINETKCGEVCEYADHEKMKETVKKYFNRYKEGTLASSAQFIEQYSRAALTKDLVTLLNKN